MRGGSRARALRQVSDPPHRPASERVLQTHVAADLLAMELAGLPLTSAADMAGSRRSPAERAWAKATGLRAGEADLRVYLPNGVLVGVEMKRQGGQRSPEQIERHALLASLGHEVVVLTAETPEQAVAAIRKLVAERLGLTVAMVVEKIEAWRRAKRTAA